MPPSPRIRGGERKRAAPPGAGRGSIDALPDDVLHHALSFLPAQEAVRTCVLARRWRHLWRSATGLRISCGFGQEAASLKELQGFVDNLLQLRGGSPLDTCQLDLLKIDALGNDDTGCADIWIRHVLMSKVRVLSLDIDPAAWVELDRLTLVSQHLKKLQLSNVQIELDGRFLDFSSCPVLEVLEFNWCGLMGCQGISSRSIKCLSLHNKCYFGSHSRPHIYVPNLISLWLETGFGLTPLLQIMPSLVEAVVNIEPYDYDTCDEAYSESEDFCEGELCLVHGDTNESMLLQGLSEAQSLVLMSDIKRFVFRRDFKFCPIFNNLKTLSLNEYWCVPADFSLLTCILEHSPVLEKLTLQLYCKGPKSKVEMEGIPDPTERSNEISKHLKIVEVKCEVVDDRVLDVLKFLSKLSIHSYRFQL